METSDKFTKQYLYTTSQGNIKEWPMIRIDWWVFAFILWRPFIYKKKVLKTLSVFRP